MNEPSSSTSMQHVHHQKVSVRSETPHIDRKQCIFCQQDKRESLHLIQELPVSSMILDASKYDQVMSVRLACVNDLTAADEAYHRVAWPQTSDIAFAWLCQELKQSAEQTDILDLVDVWDRYCKISDDAQAQIPPSFLSRMNTFKDKRPDCLEGLYEVVVVHDQARNESRTMLVPSQFRQRPVSAMINDDSDVKRLIPTFKHDDQDTFLTMVHVALQIRDDMLSHSKPIGLDISTDRAIDCIPDIMYMFLSLLQRLLENYELDCEKHENKRRLRIICIAQDLMYTANGERFLTPKHIGMASTLHQATHVSPGRSRHELSGGYQT